MAFLSSTRYSNPSGLWPQAHSQVLAFTKVGVSTTTNPYIALASAVHLLCDTNIAIG